MVNYLFDWIVSVCWIVFVVYWVVSARSAKKTIGLTALRKSAGLRVLFVVAFVLLLQIQPVREFVKYGNFIFSGPVRFVGIICTVAGIALAIRARRNLGRNWGMPMSIKENPELVTSGPYATIRHPIYAGVFLAILGSALVAGSLWILLFLLVGVQFVYSAITEERTLMKEFPDTYPVYKARTKMFIPFVW